MSVVNEDGEKVTLHRQGGSVFEVIEREWAGQDRERWQRLAMVQLHEYCGWTEAHLGIMVARDQGTVHRQIQKTKKLLGQLAGLQELLAEMRNAG